MKMIRLFMLFQLVTASAGFAGTERGGGDPVALDFQAEAAKAVAKITQGELGEVPYSRLTGILDLAKYIVSDQTLDLTLGKAIQNSAAENDPSTGTIYINRVRWNELKGETNRQSLAAHELLSLIGVEKSGDYHVSKNLKINAQSDTSGPVLLYGEYYDANSPIGLSADSAQTQCDNEKSLYEGQYYFVYCSYLEKASDINWPQLSFSYGLRVYGIRTASSLNWRTVFSSKSFGPSGEFSAEFATTSGAVDACNLEIAAAGNPAWTLPRCEIQPDGSQFYYDIQTQNPLVK